MRVLTTMYPLMCFQKALSTERLITHCTGITAITTMYALMSYQIAFLIEWLTTHLTGIRVLTTMYTLMSDQITLLLEWLITHFTGIRALTTMYPLMCFQKALSTECLITHFTWIWTLIPMYITGIYAFSTVYMRLFIQSTLGKTRRLNIRIYSDWNNNNFYRNVYIKKIQCIWGTVIDKSALDDQQFYAYYLLQIKQQLLHLCHTYFRVLHEMHSGIFLQIIKES